jgi:tetratricopeptide (TPR) repeat protein
MTRFSGLFSEKINWQTPPPSRRHMAHQTFNPTCINAQWYDATITHWGKENVREGAGEKGCQRRHNPLPWAVAVLCLILSVTGVDAQNTRWETVTTAGVQAFDQGHYDTAAQQFQAALAIAETLTQDDPRLPTSLMNLATVYQAQGQYADAERFYQRTLQLQEQLFGPEDPQLVEVLQAYADLHRRMHPWQSRLPWSKANKLATRARNIQLREESAGILAPAGLWAGSDESDIFRASE